MAELQSIPARHGTATFVPAGQVIKIINTTGTQVVDTWAFALPKPEPKPGADAQKQEDDEQKGKPNKAATKSKKKSADLPSQEDAEGVTRQGLKEGEDAAAGAAQQKSTWSSYVPSTKWLSSSKAGGKPESQDTEQQANSRTWASYFPSGKGFSNYIPKTATDTVSSFTASHTRDPNKSYMEQLQDFSRTPVGAAGFAALSGSGWGGSTYAGYQAWNAQNASNAAPMEYMSMPHCRAATLHMRPQVNDTLVSNFREPILTLIEDTSSGIHDTLIAACDPARYKGLGVEKWDEHGSCAENLVLALKELNERAGLKGAKGVGADVTINSVPAPLNLFMNIPWDDSGELGFHAPKSSKGGFVRFKAERDVVVVMSACPQDILDINNKSPTDAHFIVEADGEDAAPALKRTQPVKKRPPPRKVASSTATSTTAGAGATPVKKPLPRKKAVPQQKAAESGTAAQKRAAPQAASPAARKKPIPPPVQASKKPTPAATAGAGSAASNADGPTPVAAKKKPRKLTPKPKADA